MNKEEKMMRAFEIKANQYYFYNKLLPDGFDESKLNNGSVAFFKQFGFRVPSYFSEVYEMYNGIKSEKYVSTGLYNFTIIPYLINLNLRETYDDKNLYHLFFPDVKQPKTIVKNMNGRFYKPDPIQIVGEELSLEQTVNVIKELGRFVCKPSMQGGGGKNVQSFNSSVMSKEEIKNMLTSYSQDFLIQGILTNHPLLAELNDSSLNTCRIVTYRDVESNNYVLLGSYVRFGAHGSFMDNATSGGGFCKIFNDGLVDDRIRVLKCFEPRSLKKEKGLSEFYMPHYDEMVRTAKKLHARLAYCDIIGWDFTVTDDDKIVLVEYNSRPDIEGFQIVNGPLFGNYTESIIKRVSNPIVKPVVAVKRSFQGMSKINEHIFDLGEADKL